MGRKRTKDAWLPPRVYRGKSAFEYHPKSGGSVRLCALEAAQAVVWAEYRRVTAEAPDGSVSALIRDYLNSDEYRTRSPATQKAYRKHSGILVKVFGHVDAQALRQPHIRTFMDKRGQKAKVAANRELALLSVVCRWGIERGRLSENPCLGIRRFSERGRDRYVTDAEFAAVYSVAPLSVRVAMEIAYLCAARQGDILSLTRFNVRGEGLYIQQGKTGIEQIKAWTPRLRSAVDAAIEDDPGASHLIHTRKGDRLTSSGFHSIFYRAQRRANQSGWTFHDVKAKAITDFRGDKQRFSGHRSSRMVALYDRLPAVVDTLE